MPLTKYEIEVLRLMLKSEFKSDEIETIINSGVLAIDDFTSAGYFIEISHELLPIQRKVITEPFILGKVEGIQVGFILFLENKMLTIECHGWGVIDLPKDIRSKSMQLAALKK